MSLFPQPDRPVPEFTYRIDRRDLEKRPQLHENHRIQALLPDALYRILRTIPRSLDRDCAEETRISPAELNLPCAAATSNPDRVV